MADVLPTPSHLSIDISRERNSHAPLPNPSFVFPIQLEGRNEMDSHDDTAPSMSPSRSQRAGPRSKPQHLSLGSLPAFDFSPASSSPTKSSPSPSRSPTRWTPPVPHGAGHRRNGSEYVGGGITFGGPMLVSSSPTRSEDSGGHRQNRSEVFGEVTTSNSLGLTDAHGPEGDGYSNPHPNTRLGPPTGRRGHAHRRSGAISSHDLSTILNPPVESKTGSAPTTPSDPLFQRVPPSDLDRSASQPVLSTTASESLPLSTHPINADSEGQARPRLRFSEKIDYIPRPISTVSSETSSSMSTIRANHSVSNSISSVVSANSAPPYINQTTRRSQTLQEPYDEAVQSRPKTAEARSHPSSEELGLNSVDVGTSPPRPSSAPSDGFPFQGTRTSVTVPIDHNSTSTKQAFNELFTRHTQAVSSSPKSVNMQLPRRRPNSPSTRPRTSPEPKVTKRQAKGRSWAGLLSRKGKHQEFKKEMMRRSPTPLLRQPSPEMGLSFDDINFNDDTTYLMGNGSNFTSQPPESHVSSTDRKPRESSETYDSASVLDIDAEFSCFSSTGSGPSFEDVVGGMSSGLKRPMHSSGTTGGFVGPGMHYHRRAESAPELEPVDRSRFGFPRLGSNPAMAIEEEEEEEDEEDKTKILSDPAEEVDQSRQKYQSEEQTLGLGVNIVEADKIEQRPIQRAKRNTDSTMKHEQKHHEKLGTIEVVGADEEPRFSVITKSSDESTITPALSPDPLATFAAPAPPDIAMPTPALTYGTPATPSDFASPDFSRISFDAPRVHTATSSITDRATLNSSRAGDQVLGFHSSIDDVPSLTSSASTMSAHPTRFSSSANSAADRSSSLSAAVPSRTRPVSAHKRLSLASLSRLAGNSYNRSKLNIEETAPVETVGHTEKKKRNRISRMMKFWKSKEKLSSP